MSRIGKQSIFIPKEVTINLNNQTIFVKGPQGEISKKLPFLITVTQENDYLFVQRTNDSLIARQNHGLYRTLISNLITGVSSVFEKRLELRGVGYRAQMDGKKLILNVGFSHPVEIVPPEGITIAVENNTNVIVKGINKELVGKIASQIRSIRSPEPYKGKGIRYFGEIVKRKVGKTGKK
uniref:Large ribosomal subunit protein uL6c n=1 Tax=Cyanoptyche gloeocystis TaxID=77922 RepID=A0A3G1IWI0_9EUKA|nr:ribosomal protein L6 [Cyanoptyche gloeocystis]